MFSSYSSAKPVGSRIPQPGKLGQPARITVFSPDGVGEFYLVPKANRNPVPLILHTIMQITRCVMIVATFAASFVLGCSPSMDRGGRSQAEIDPDDDEREMSATEIGYCKFADEFARDLVSGNVPGSYSKLCSQLRSRLSQAEFEHQLQRETQTYGRVLHCDPAEYCETDPSVLGGPDRVSTAGDPLDVAFQKIDAARAVGEMPADIPPELRRAAVQVTLAMDPRSIPDLVNSYEASELDELEPVSYLHVVLVEENGQLAVGYFFRRWPDMLD